MALIVNSAGFNVMIECENPQGQELGWDGGEPINPGVTRYITADRVVGNGGTCLCAVYVPVLVTPGTDGVPVSAWERGAEITSTTIGPHDLWYFIGGSLTTDSAGLQYTDDSNRVGW